MPCRTLDAIVLIAIGALSTAAAGQNAYKCGDSYSQLPCPGGVVVNAADQRTAAQKAQADAASSRAARTADAMEKARLQQERLDLAANTPMARPAGVEAAGGTSKSLARKKKKKVPEFFTAQVPGQKKKPASRKRASNKDTGKS